METHAVFDIQGYVKSMTDAGAEPRLAEAIAHGQIAYFNATFATKKDIEDLRAATAKYIEGLRKDMTVELAKLETKLTTAIAESQFKIILSLGGLMAFFGSIIAILKLL